MVCGVVLLRQINGGTRRHRRSVLAACLALHSGERNSKSRAERGANFAVIAWLCCVASSHRHAPLQVSQTHLPSAAPAALLTQQPAARCQAVGPLVHSASVPELRPSVALQNLCLRWALPAC